MLCCVQSATLVARQGLSLENAALVLGLPAPAHTERAIDRIAAATVLSTHSTVTNESGDQISSISRPASPGGQQAPLLGGSGSTSTSDATAQPEILARQSNYAEMIDVADSQFTGLLILTGCTVVRISFDFRTSGTYLIWFSYAGVRAWRQRRRKFNWTSTNCSCTLGTAPFRCCEMLHCARCGRFFTIVACVLAGRRRWMDGGRALAADAGRSVLCTRDRDRRVKNYRHRRE